MIIAFFYGMGLPNGKNNLVYSLFEVAGAVLEFIFSKWFILFLF
jgi:hypothetical protein